MDHSGMEYAPTILDKCLRLFQPILQSYWTLTKQTLFPPSPQFNVINNAETTFGNIPWHKLNIELGERGLIRRATWFNMEFITKICEFCIGGKIVLTSYVQDCSSYILTKFLIEKDFSSGLKWTKNHSSNIRHVIWVSKTIASIDHDILASASEFNGMAKTESYSRESYVGELFYDFREWGSSHAHFFQGHPISLSPDVFDFHVFNYYDVW
jgi:hypothetical protein